MAEVKRSRLARFDVRGGMHERRGALPSGEAPVLPIKAK